MKLGDHCDHQAAYLLPISLSVRIPCIRAESVANELPVPSSASVYVLGPSWAGMIREPFVAGHG